MQVPEMQMQYQMVPPPTQWQPVAFIPHAMPQQHYAHHQNQMPNQMQPNQMQQPNHHQNQMRQQQNHAMPPRCAMPQQSAHQAYHAAPQYQQLRPASTEESDDTDQASV